MYICCDYFSEVTISYVTVSYNCLNYFSINMDLNIGTLTSSFIHMLTFNLTYYVLIY